MAAGYDHEQEYAASVIRRRQRDAEARRGPITREAIPLTDAAADALLILAEAERAGAAVRSSWYPTSVKRINGKTDVNLQGNTIASLRRRGLAEKSAGRWRLTAEGRAVVDGQLSGDNLWAV